MRSSSLSTLVFLLLLSSLPSLSLCHAPSRALVPAQTAPVIRSVVGCISSAGGPTQCHTGDSLTLLGSGLEPPIANITLNDRYSCFPIFHINDSAVRATVPAIPWPDQERALAVRIARLSGLTSAPFVGVMSYGTLSIASFSGCGTVGAPVSVLRGCKAGDAITVIGSGFGSSGALQASVGIGMVNLTACNSTTRLSNVTLRCVLPSYPVPGAPLTLSVLSGTTTTTRTGAVVYVAVPVLTGVTGCVDYKRLPTGNYSYTRECRPQQSTRPHGRPSSALSQPPSAPLTAVRCALRRCVRQTSP